MLSPLNGGEPRTRPTPASQTRSGNSSFDLQRMETDLRHRQEQLADERARLGEERRAIARERAELDAERDARIEGQRVEQHTEQRRTEATAIAADLSHDIDRNRPGYTAGLIIAAAKKARGLSGVEEPTGLAAAIVNAGRVARGEAVAGSSPPDNPMAKAITIAGMRARGDPVSESEAAFLSAFLQKLGPRT